MINNNILLCLFSLLIVVLFSFYRPKKIENFNNNFKRYAYNIIPKLDKKSYIGTFIPTNKEIYKGNLVITNSLKSEIWKGPLKNSLPAPKSIIVDLLYNLEDKLMCVAMTKIKETKVFNIYIKESQDIESKWLKIKSNENIRSICFDLNNKLLGCHGDNGQIYRKESTDLNSDWYGPINYDIPMKKIYFDRDDIMIGIGMFDHYIYKKMDQNWENSAWDKNNINKTRVFDIVHDSDGRLLATTYQNILKQKDPHYLSSFINYKISYDKENLMSFDEIMKCKTGIDDESFTNRHIKSYF